MSHILTKVNIFQAICGTIETQMKFYKLVARPSFLHSSETWVTTQRDMTGLEVCRDALSEKCYGIHKTG